jgi:predicted DNA-binding transcriptional regulator YafY
MAIKPYCFMKSLLHRLIRLDHLIAHKSTGTPADCANKIGISERSLYDYLKILKEMGAPVKFSRDRRTYFYSEGGHFHISFLPKEREAQYFELEEDALVSA